MSRITSYDALPEYMRESARLYIEDGFLPGSFLMAVLCNDLVGAGGAADAVNKHMLFVWAGWLYNDVPSPAWGSREKVEEWAANRRAQVAEPPL